MNTQAHLYNDFVINHSSLCSTALISDLQHTSQCGNDPCPAVLNFVIPQV